MRAYVGVTDDQWFELLASTPNLDEVNFWQPSGSRGFHAIQPGEPFLFKLHAPNNFIVGGGFFAHATLLPVSLAWDCFGISNGVKTLNEMRSRIEHYRRAGTNAREDYTIGCLLLEQPFFFPRRDWIPVPSDWRPNIVQGRTYDLAAEPGKSLWLEVQARLAGRPTRLELPAVASPVEFGAPQVIRPRLGQGSFRVLVTDAYQRKCAMTGEKTLPVLEAAHIQGVAAGGTHSVSNGLLLRADLHTLFDRGYVTVTTDYRIEVSRRIREEFSNGRHYYALEGQQILQPEVEEFVPAKKALEWHHEHVFRG